MDPDRADAQVAPEGRFWAAWTVHGVWAKSAVVLGVVSIVAAISGSMTEYDLQSVPLRLELQQAAQAIGRLTPFLVIVALLTESRCQRRWAFLGLVIWAAASAIVAIASLHSTVNYFELFGEAAAT